MKRAMSAPIWLALLVAFLSLGFGPCRRDLNPVIFVHGGSGSGAQFESQAQRFASNGYPSGHVAVLEYDSASIDTILPDVLAALDELVADLQAETGRAQVDLVGHSLGTFVSQSYLATPVRAANVAHYVNVDGRSAGAPPGGVPTLALWAGAVRRPVPGEIVGAKNVTIPNQEHVQVATSAESFFEMYSFFRGHRPLTTRILPELRPRVSGRVVDFPSNVGLAGATLEIWRVDRATGERIGTHPRATFAIGPDGSFGPFKAVLGAHYEFTVLREGEPTYHAFYEPFLRDDHLVRLNIAPLLEPFLEENDASSSVAVIRYKEFWGDRGAENDVLSIGGTNVINATTAPSGAVGAASVAFIGFDVGLDGVSNLTRIPFPLGPLPFLTGADVFVPAVPPGTLSIVTVPRGNLRATRTLNVRNIPSADGQVVVQLRDFEQ